MMKPRRNADWKIYECIKTRGWVVLLLLGCNACLPRSVTPTIPVFLPESQSLISVTPVASITPSTAASPTSTPAPTFTSTSTVTSIPTVTATPEPTPFGGGEGEIWFNRYLQTKPLLVEIVKMDLTTKNMQRWERSTNQAVLLRLDQKQGEIAWLDCTTEPCTYFVSTLAGEDILSMTLPELWNRKVYSFPLANYLFVITPDLRHLIYRGSGSQPCKGGADLLLLAAGEAEPKQLTQGCGAMIDPVVSPDGKRLIWDSINCPEGVKECWWVMNIDGTEGTSLNASDFGVRTPIWSPDSEWLAYSLYEKGRVRVLLDSADYTLLNPTVFITKNGTEVKSIGYGDVIGWMPDSNRLLVSRIDERSGGKESYSLGLIGLDGTELDRFPGEYFRVVSFSPDYQKAITWKYRDYKYKVSLFNLDAMLDVPIDIQLVWSDPPIIGELITTSWSPDSRWVVFSGITAEHLNPASVQLYLYSVEEGKITPLTPLDEGKMFPMYFGPWWH